MECKSCEAVVVYKDKNGKFHDTLEKCQEANREYKRQEARKKFVDHLIENSYYWQLAYREYPYGDMLNNFEKPARCSAKDFLSDPRNVKALMEAHEIYYKYLGDDL